MHCLRVLFAAAALSLAAAVPPAAAQGPVTVYKSPTCGCCKLWVDHLAAAGFEVQVHERTDLAAEKQRLGVPPRLAACHTAVVDGYVVEGHVPAADLRRLLAERPDVAGLAVPGMPMGSPGMEFGPPVPYDVLTFDRDGATRVFASHGR